MRKFKKLTMTLALLLTAVTGAWAQEETLLTTITPTAKEQASYSTANVATVSFSYTAYGSSAYKDDWGWWGYGWIATVTAAEGYTITKCIFYDDANRTATDSEAPFVVETTEDDKTPRINGTPIDGGNMWSKGIKKIEVYGYKSEPTEWSLTPDETGKTWTLAKMPASDVELQVEYEPTKVTMAANDNAMGTVEVAGQSKVEWTADTWKGWTSDIKEYTVDDITMTSSQSARIREYTSEDEYNNSLFFFVRKMYDDDTVTFSTTGDPFSRIEFTMIGDYSDWNPSIIPNDNWTFEGKSAVWEGEATKSLTLQSCSTQVSKITFYKGAIPDGVTINTDGTFTVAKTATVTLKATPAEGYKFLYWEDDQTNTNPVREVTIESGMADMTYKAVFAEITYNVTFVEGTDLNEWTATPNTEVKKDTKVDIKYTGTKKVIGVKVEKKEAGPLAAAFKDGAKFKVGYQWNFGYTTYLEFTNSGGTYSLTSVSGLNEENGFNSSTLTVKNGNVLALDVVCQPNGDRMDEFCAQIEFDATSSTYKYSSKGSNFTGIISVSVNDTDITSQLTKEN